MYPVSQKADGRSVRVWKFFVVAGHRLTYQQSVCPQQLQHELHIIHRGVKASPQESEKWRLLPSDIFVSPIVQ